MNDKKQYTSSSNEDTLWNFMVIILCIVPLIAGIVAWLITIPFCYFLINFKQHQFNKLHNKLSKEKYSNYLFVFSLLTALVFILAMVFTILLSINHNWFDSNNIESLVESCIVVFCWITLLFISGIVIFVLIKQKKYISIIGLDYDKKINVAKELENRSLWKIILDGLVHNNLCLKLCVKLDSYIFDEQSQINNDVVLSKKEKVIVPDFALATGSLVLGATGTGKTNTILHFVKQAVKSGKFIVFVNGKADDDLKNQLGNLAQANGYRLLHWNLKNDQCNFNYNILKDKTPDEIISLLLEIENYEAIARAGKYEVLHYSIISQNIYEYYIPFMLNYWLPNNHCKALDFQVLYDNANYKKQLNILNNSKMLKDNPEARRIINKIITKGKQDLTPEEFRLWKTDDTLAKYRDVYDNLMKVWDNPDPNGKKDTHKFTDQWEQIGNTFYLLNKLNKGGNLLSNKGDSLKDLLNNDQKTILFFNMDATSNPIGVGKIGRMIIMDIRQQLEKLAQTSKKLCFVCDEFSSYACNAIADILEKGRSAGCQTIVSAQTIAGFKFVSDVFKERIFGNTDTKIFHRINNANDPEEIASFFGTFNDIEKTYQTSEGDVGTKGSVRLVDKFVVHPNDIKRLESYYAYIMTLGILRNRKGQESKRPLIYNKKIKIDYCGINASKFTIDTSRITRQAKVANMSDVEFNVFRKMTWNSHKQKYNLNGECPNNFIPTKEIYIEQGVK